MSTRKILATFVADLERSGLTQETAIEAGLYTEDDHVKLGAMLKCPYPKKRGAALVFPFPDIDGNVNGFARVKVSFPAKDRNGNSVRYLQVRKQENHPYFPRKTLPILRDPTIELVIVEGEKKALACTQFGFPAIAVTGVWGWKHGTKTDRLIPGILSIAWKGRRVLICFDSDIFTNPKLKDAAPRLAKLLTALGAVVKVVQLPDGPDGVKWGADDFLVARGDNAKVEFRKLLDSAGDPDEPEESDKVAASELDPMDEARRFLDFNAKQDGELKLRAWRGVFHFYRGMQYKEQDPQFIEALVWKYLDVIARLINRSVVANITAAIRSQTIIPADRPQPLWIDGRGRPENFIAMKNGILNIEAVLKGDPNYLTPHTPLWFSSICLPYEYNPDATCPKWIESLNKNLDGDESRIALLQEFIGLCLVFDTTFQKFLLLTGDGGTGKSTTLAGMAAMLGAGNVSHLGLEAFGQRFQTYTTLGKLANICFDSGEIDKTAEGIIKSFTSGDPMPFERKFHDNVDAVPTARLILATNTLPRFSDRTSGIWRRMIVMPFKRIVPESEKVLGMDKLDWWRAQGELPGIFNWSIEGLKRLRRNQKFTASSACNAELAEYRRESNPAALFLAENCTADEAGDVVTADAYSRYVKWCQENGFRSLASNTFGKEIVRAFPLAQKGKVWNRDGRRVEGYKGVKINDELGNGENGNNENNPDIPVNPFGDGAGQS